MKILKCLLMIVTAPVILVLTLFVWLCAGLIYISGLVLGLLDVYKRQGICRRQKLHPQCSLHQPYGHSGHL